MAKYLRQHAAPVLGVSVKTSRNHIFTLTLNIACDRADRAVHRLCCRGFALQRLQHIMTPIKATLVIAFFHLLWHAPTYWLGQDIHNVPAIWMVLFLLPWTI